MKKLFVIVTVFATCYAGSCKDNPFAEHASRFRIRNDSEKGIAFLVSEIYPDTTIPDTEMELGGVPAMDEVPSNSYDEWSEVFDRLPKDTLSIFIFSGDTLAKYSWQEIRSGYKILKRYDLSLRDLDSMNYTITYP